MSSSSSSSRILVQKAPSLKGQPLPNFIMIELQGVIEIKNPAAFENTVETKLGVFKYEKKSPSDKEGKPVLIVGLSRLEGSKVKLPSPYIVTEKCKVSETETCYNAVGIIHEKYLFKNRPKTL